MKFRSKVVAVISATLPLLTAFPAVAGIEGSIHDFSAYTWSGGEICKVCHTPHNSTNDTQAPLWNHAISSATYNLYDSRTLKRKPVQPEPGSVSRMCLSCHDGTIAIDSYGTRIGGTNMTGSANLGTDLSNDHPVGILWDHQTQTSGSFDCLKCHNVIVHPNGAITLDPKVGNELKFFNHRVECPSCHDVHDKQVKDKKLLRKSLTGSALCMHCHPK